MINYFKYYVNSNYIVYFSINSSLFNIFKNNHILLNFHSLLFSFIRINKYNFLNYYNYFIYLFNFDSNLNFFLFDSYYKIYLHDYNFLNYICYNINLSQFIFYRNSFLLIDNTFISYFDFIFLVFYTFTLLYYYNINLILSLYNLIIQWLCFLIYY